jgi:two-component system response regulator DegU
VAKINVLIVDDEALLREGLHAMLEKENFISEIVGAEDEEGFVQQLATNRIDVILLDIRLRKTSGFELLKRLQAFSYQPKVIAVTGLDSVDVIINLLKLNVHGIVYKLDGYGEIIKAIRAVSTNGTYFPENILKIIQVNAQRWNDTPTVLFSFQEMELLRAIASGATTKEFAAELKMSPGTAETYRIRLMKKVGVSNTAGLLAYAFRNGIL